MISPLRNPLPRLLAAAILLPALAACSAVSDVGRGAVRSVSRAGEAVAGRITQAGTPEAKAELPKLDRDIAVEVIADPSITNGTPRGYPKPLPAFDGDRVYTLTASRRQVLAHTLPDGKRQWKASLKDEVTGGVGAGDGLVLVGTSNGDVVALSAEDGRSAGARRSKARCWHRPPRARAWSWSPPVTGISTASAPPTVRASGASSATCPPCRCAVAARH